MKKSTIIFSFLFLVALFTSHVFAQDNVDYPVVDTGQTQCYGNSQAIVCPQPGEPFYGQDAQYESAQPSYQDNGDGTVTDLNTGLMWVKARGSKIPWSEALAGAAQCNVGGYQDWRMPTIKELYSLIQFTGSQHTKTPYLDADYFDFVFGDESAGERSIDCQDWSSTEYVSTTMNGNPTAFGVNFADGRIKGYPKEARTLRGNKIHKLYVRYVRGNSAYGKNRFSDNGDNTVTDLATGLMWDQADSGRGMNWEDALAWVETKNRERYLGYSDWRLPSIKELQSIADYKRSPDTTNSAAIDPVFQCTSITNEGGEKDYPFYWSGTTHLDNHGGAYVSFGRALGWMESPRQTGSYQLMDVHGAGAQRSDPKTGDPSAYPHGKGPQGDVIRINNYVRLVRDGDVRTVLGDQTVIPESTRNTEGGPGRPESLQESGRGMQQGGTPPQEAIEACQGHQEGDSVKFQTPHGTVQGTCRRIEGQLACVPERRPSGGGHSRF